MRFFIGKIGVLLKPLKSTKILIRLKKLRQLPHVNVKMVLYFPEYTAYCYFYKKITPIQ